jgi:outer membrane immunogenic protein
MFRKKLLLASLVSASMIPAIAQADTKNFEGLSAGLNLNLISAAAKLAVVGDSLDGLGGKQTQTAAVDAAYGLSLGGKGVLTIGLEADLSDATIASSTLDGDKLDVKLKNRYGVYLAPGVALTKDALVYAKLGYNQLKGELAGATGSASKTFRGVSYGAGARVMLSGNTFLKVEFGRYTFGSETVGDGADTKPSATVGTIGIGMNF